MSGSSSTSRIRAGPSSGHRGSPDMFPSMGTSAQPPRRWTGWPVRFDADLSEGTPPLGSRAARIGPVILAVLHAVTRSRVTTPNVPPAGSSGYLASSMGALLGWVVLGGIGGTIGYRFALVLYDPQAGMANLAL